MLVDRLYLPASFLANSSVKEASRTTFLTVGKGYPIKILPSERHPFQLAVGLAKASGTWGASEIVECNVNGHAVKLQFIWNHEKYLQRNSEEYGFYIYKGESHANACVVAHTPHVAFCSTQALLA